LQEAKIWGFGKESFFPGCKEGFLLGKEEWGGLERGLAPFLGCRRCRNIGVQGSIPRSGEDGVIGAGAAPLFEPGTPGFP